MAVCPRNILALCAGVGGLELGIALALGVRGEAGRGICYVEREAAAAASLVASMEAGWLHPAPVWSDLATFDARPWRGLVHILASGDPCQDNSVAGERAGSDGERFLAPEVVRVAGECRPDLIFRENVTGNAGEQLEALAPPLERMGFRVAAGIFSSAETGNTMQRDRMFILAERDRRGEAEEQVGIAGGSDTPWAGLAGRAVAGAEFDDVASRAHVADFPQGGRADGLSGRSGEPLAGAARVEPPQRFGSAIAGRPMGQGYPSAGVRRGELAGAFGHGGAAGIPAPSTGDGERAESTVAHHDCRRLERCPPAVIPGPTDSRWIDVLDRWPELQPALSQEEVESHLRRGIDAMAFRVERLRATGNGVDPVAAAYAFLRLDALLAKSRAAGPAIVMAA
jgi:DNA (cytosine-5)-methyltransferase 1